MCATGSEGLRNACYAVASGAFDIGMAVGVEKLKDSGFSGLVSASVPKRGTLPETTGSGPLQPPSSGIRPKYGVDEAELRDVFTTIAWKNHCNGARNPRAQIQKRCRKRRSPRRPRSPACSACSTAPVCLTLSGIHWVRAEDAYRYTDSPLRQGPVIVAGPAKGNIDPGYDFTSFPEVVARLTDAYTQAGVNDPASSWLWRVHDCLPHRIGIHGGPGFCRTRFRLGRRFLPVPATDGTPRQPQWRPQGFRSPWPPSKGQCDISNVGYSFAASARRRNNYQRGHRPLAGAHPQLGGQPGECVSFVSVVLHAATD